MAHLSDKKKEKKNHRGGEERGEGGLVTRQKRRRLEQEKHLRPGTGGIQIQIKKTDVKQGSQPSGVGKE